MAPSRFATAKTSEAGTNRNSGFGSMKRLMSHGQAMRSTRARSRVIHFMMSLLSKLRNRERPQTAAQDSDGGARRHQLERREPPGQERDHRRDHDGHREEIGHRVWRDAGQRDGQH